MFYSKKTKLERRIYKTFPNTPPEGINPIDGLDSGQVALLLLASIAFEELGLAHLINTEAEKLQGAIGTLVDENGVLVNPLIQAGSLAELLQVNREVEKLLRTVVKKEMLLEFKFENVLDLIATISPPAINRIYVANAGERISMDDDTVLVIDGATNTVIANIYFKE